MTPAPEAYGNKLQFFKRAEAWRHEQNFSSSDENAFLSAPLPVFRNHQGFARNSCPCENDTFLWRPINQVFGELFVNHSTRQGYVRAFVAVNPSASTSMLERLAQDNRGYVRKAVAGNPNAPTYLTEELLHDSDSNVTAFAALSLLAKR